MFCHNSCSLINPSSGCKSPVFFCFNFADAVLPSGMSEQETRTLCLPLSCTQGGVRIATMLSYKTCVQVECNEAMRLLELSSEESGQTARQWSWSSGRPVRLAHHVLNPAPRDYSFSKTLFIAVYCLLSLISDE